MIVGKYRVIHFDAIIFPTDVYEAWTEFSHNNELFKYKIMLIDSEHKDAKPSVVVGGENDYGFIKFINYHNQQDGIRPTNYGY